MAGSTLPHTGAYQLAVLDDYASISKDYFTPLPLTVSHFPDTLNANTPEGLASLCQKLYPYTIISSMRERTAFPAQLLASLPNLRLLLTTGMRNAAIDLKAASENHVVVTGTTGKVGDEVKARDTTTQHALSLLLSLTSRIPVDHGRLTASASNAASASDSRSQKSAWQSGYTVPLQGKTLGIVGLGRLGAQLARIAVLALDMKVIAWSPNLTQATADETATAQGLPAGSFVHVSKQELFSTADIVSLHLVLSDRSRGVVGREELALMKASAFVVNTARAGLVDEDAFYHVLAEGKLAGAAMDVFWEEPMPKQSRWRTTKWGEDGRSVVVLSPHMGYVNEVTLSTWYQEQAGIVEKWLAGGELANRLN